MDLILDTNAVSALLDGEAAVEAVIGAAENVAIPVVVIGEYRFGILQSHRRENYETIFAKLIARTRILNITEITASRYAQVRLDLKRAGTPIPENDLWIAALARQHDFTVLSRDRHFDRVEGLRRIGW